ncbi:MAG: aspartate--tRNA ligase [Puniceicoccales bacterium]|jgi:aspartyl-tRNA synthetase|nr:aspartate--tRNA ligase [Puniceicoccales bacterium]
MDLQGRLEETLPSEDGMADWRTHRCGELGLGNVGGRVRLAGWMQSKRDHGGLGFIDLRDRSGLVQLVVDGTVHANLAHLMDLHCESVIAVDGLLVRRSAETVNEKLATGAVEVRVDRATVLGAADVLPFPLDDAHADLVGEELRLTYRYLDLRREKCRQRLVQRHRIQTAVRNYLNGQEFLEIDLPILFKSTPEGAREFLVPSRLHPGEFYALAQSPQQYKQMLMVAGLERYYSMARCFRDEDLRSDRQPEFTQIDLEMSFVGREDIHRLVEGLLQSIWRDVLGLNLTLPLPRLPFHEAMDRYGSDKPDLRFALELVDLSSALRHAKLQIFSNALRDGGVVKALNAKGLANISQGELATLEETARAMGAPGLAFLAMVNGQLRSPIAKFLSREEQDAIVAALQLQEGDVAFFAAAPWETACSILGRVRLDCAELLKKRGQLHLSSNSFHLLWITDFPLLTYDGEQGRHVATHHPFTAPIPEDMPLLDSNPAAVRGQHYDLVLNGMELGGGSIRIHSPQLQRKIFEDLLKIPPDIVENRFGYLLRAFRYGTPPHGGIAIGFDRLVAMLCGTDSIRDVVAFPKNQRGVDLMARSPAPVAERQLKELSIALR